MDESNFKLPSETSVKHKFASRKTSSTPDAEPPLNPTEPVAEPNYESVSLETPKTVSSTTPQPHQNSTPASQETPTASPKLPTVPCPYVEPKWSAAASPENVYSIEMLKNGTIVETVADLQSQPFWLIGKLTSNHIVMAHPTVSRYHAVLQYRPEIEPGDSSIEPASDETTAAESGEPSSSTSNTTNATKPRIASGWYLYDLGSTHGSFVNKRKVPAKTYVRVRVGYMLSFGASTRRLILQGPDFDAEAESELSITEMKEARAQKAAAIADQVRLDRERIVEEERKREAEGVSWGMGEDADEETDLSVNPYASTNNEELFLQDPKKTLRGYFEREGLDLEYKVDELSTGSFLCKIVLPVSDSNGRPIVCEVSHKGKKKECVVQGALEACRVLDRHGVLRQSHHESRKRKIEHSDSDGDDDFYDRTGAVERKREEKDAVQQTKAFSYEDLLEQERELLAKLSDVNVRIEHYQQLEKRKKECAKAEHDLDDFMTQLSDEKFDKTDIRRLRVEAKSIEADHSKLQRLIRIARPVNLPKLVSVVGADTVEKKKLALPLFGKRGTFKFGTTSATVQKECARIKQAANGHASNEEEEDDETDDQKIDEICNASIDKESEKVKSEEKEPHVSIPVRSRKDNSATAQKISANADTAIDEIDQLKNADLPETSAADSENAAGAKKKRSRPRIRGERGRDNIDIDEPAELLSNTEKCSTWLPPANQSGDGNTSLNDKFGY